MKKQSCRTVYIAEHRYEKINRTAVYGYDPKNNEAFVFIINGRIIEDAGTRTHFSENIIGPCIMSKILKMYKVPFKHLDAIVEEYPF